MLSRFEIFCISPQENFFGLCLFVFFFLLGKDELFKTFSVFSRKLFKIFDFSLILKIGGPLCPLVFSM